MTRFIRNVGLGGLLLAMAGCMPVPTTTIREPLTVRPQEVKAPRVAENNGAILNLRGFGPMFEDRRARAVGDVLIVTIAENTTAAEKSASNATNSGSIAFSSPTITAGVGAQTIQTPYGVNGTSAFASASKSDNSGNNAFTGTITVTVTEVLPNGNLRVGGEKQVSIKNANEFIRFSGVVNPNTINGSNTVSSTQVADVQLEYKGVNSIDGAAVLSMFSKVFLAILPF